MYIYLYSCIYIYIYTHVYIYIFFICRFQSVFVANSSRITKPHFKIEKIQRFGGDKSKNAWTGLTGAYI